MSDELKEAMKRVYGGDKPAEYKSVGNDPKAKDLLKKIYGNAQLASKNLSNDEPKKITKEDAKKIEQDVLQELKKSEVTKKTGYHSKEKIELTTSVNPHIKNKENVNSIMWAVIISLLPALIAGVYFFGMRALWIILLGVVSASATEFIIVKLTKKDMTVMDGSAVITGLLLSLVLPPTVPLWVPVLGAIFSISIGKMIFGGLGHNIFNPALVGRTFLMASFPAIMTTWILPDGVAGATPLGLWKLQGIKTSYMQLFVGNIGGSIGETSAIALLIGAAFLLYKKVIDWRIPAGFIGAAAIFALAFRQDVLFHILAGGLLIGAFFMATDYVTSPLTRNGKLIFGIGCGFLTMIFRLFSGYPEGVMFAILLMNATTPLIDRFTKLKPFGYRKPAQ